MLCYVILSYDNLTLCYVKPNVKLCYIKSYVMLILCYVKSYITSYVILCDVKSYIIRVVVAVISISSSSTPQ